MTRGRKPPRKQPDPPNYHIDKMLFGVETFTRHCLTCFVCGDEEQVIDEEPKKFVEDLYKNGWRYKESEVFQTIGPMCKKCANMTDKQRLDEYGS